MRYRFADCELDTEARALCVGGRAVRVERQVFDILCLLAEHAGMLVSRELLLARVWNGRIVSDSAIASRMNAARRAVGDDGRRQGVIATEARFGFRLVADVSVESGSEGRPSVAILPLAIGSGMEGDDHLARGIADQMAGTLGQARRFDVIDTAASFAPSLRGLPLPELSDRLAARYVVTGSLEIAGRTLRVRLRLVEPAQGKQIWAGSFDGTREGIFGLQDRIGAAVLAELEPHLLRHEIRLSRSRHGTASAYDHYLRAADLLHRVDGGTMLAARAELDRAIAQFRDYAVAHAMKAWIATLMVSGGLDVDPEQERATAEHALALGPLDCDALSMAGYAYGFFTRDPEGGLDHVTRALALNPSSARTHDHAGWLMLYSGRSGEAAAHFDRGIALCPLDEFRFRMLTGRAFASLFGGDHAAAIALARRARTAAPGYTVCHRVLVAALAQSGRQAEAEAVAAELKARSPGFTVARYETETRFQRGADRDVLLSGLRMAGLS